MGRTSDGSAHNVFGEKKMVERNNSGADWIHLTSDRDQLWTPVDIVMNL
jgi:hypothetical protein